MNQNLIPLACAAVMAAAVNTGLFDSLCSVSAPAAASGAITGVYTAVVGLQSLACMDAPDNFGNGLSATEVKALAETASMALRHVLLNKYYSLLSPTSNWGDLGWRAAITGPTGDVVTYDILGAEADSQQTQTRLKLRKVSV